VYRHIRRCEYNIKMVLGQIKLEGEDCIILVQRSNDSLLLTQ